MIIQQWLQRPRLLALQTILVDSECFLKEVLFLLGVDGLETGCDGGAWGPTSVEDVATVVVLSLVQQGLNTGLGVAPSTGVQRLFLSPDNVLGVRVAVQVLLQLSPREGVQLLNTGDGSVADTIGLTMLDQGSIDLTSAQNDALDLLGLVNGATVGRVRDDPPEVRVTGEFLNIGASNRMTEEGLGEEDHEGYGK
jgi:hypothetical protein